MRLPTPGADQAQHHTPGAPAAATGPRRPREGVTLRTEGTFRGGLAGFTGLRALAEVFGAAAGAEHATTLRVVLVLEELYTNTVTHGYPADIDGAVWVALASDGGAITVTYEDAAPAFDPLSHAPVPAPPTEERAPGGLGLALVRGLCVSASYARIGGRNRLTFTVDRSSPPP